MQNSIAALAVILSTLYAAWRIYKAVRRNDNPCEGCPGCPMKPAEKAQQNCIRTSKKAKEGKKRGKQ